eukprot:2120450-Rhodomonas_salina.1
MHGQTAHGGVDGRGGREEDWRWPQSHQQRPGEPHFLTLAQSRTHRNPPEILRLLLTPAFCLQGDLVVAGIQKAGPAGRSGKLQLGDVLLAVDGQEVALASRCCAHSFTGPCPALTCVGAPGKRADA